MRYAIFEVSGPFRGAIRTEAINRSRYRQVGGQGQPLIGVRKVIVSGRGAALPGSGAITAIRGTVGRPAGVVDRVGPSALVAPQVRFHNIPVKERERLVEVRDAVG